MSSTASVDQLAARFLACAIPREEWTHHAHLVVGAWHVHRYGPERALALLRVGIRRLNEANGVVNSAASGYHETITRAYVALLAQLLDACPVGMSLGERVVRIVAGPLADKDVLFTFYSRARLMSAAGRAAWIEPDLAPLRLTATFADEGTAQAGPANFPPPPQVSPSHRADGPLGLRTKEDSDGFDS